MWATPLNFSRDRANRKQPTLSFKPEIISTKPRYTPITHLSLPRFPPPFPGISWACGFSHTSSEARSHTRESCHPFAAPGSLAAQLPSSWLWNPDLPRCNQSSEQFKRGDPWNLTTGTLPSPQSHTPLPCKLDLTVALSRPHELPSFRGISKRRSDTSCNL